MTTVPAFPHFRPIALADRVSIEAIAARFLPYSDFIFSGLWAWDTDEHCAIAMLGDNLVFRLKDYTNEDHFYTFLGRDDIVEASAVLLAHARQVGLLPQLKLIPEEMIAADERLGRCFSVAADRDNFDYIYSINDWAQFPGSRFRTHRNMHLRCRAQAELEFLSLDLGDTTAQAAINDLFQRWEAQRPAIAVGRDRSEWRALQRMYSLSNDERRAATGCYHGDRLVGFSIWEVLPGDEYAVGHFQKADRAYKGLSSWQAHDSGQRLMAQGCRLLNTEQDLGIPGLRSHKLSLRPCTHLRKYVIAEHCTTPEQVR